MKGKGTASPAPWLQSPEDDVPGQQAATARCVSCPLWWWTGGRPRSTRCKFIGAAARPAPVRGWIRAACARHAAERLASDLHKLQRQRQPAGMRVRSAPEINLPFRAASIAALGGPPRLPLIQMKNLRYGENGQSEAFVRGNNRFSRHGLLLGTKDIQIHFRARILPNHQLSMVVCQTGSFRASSKDSPYPF